MVPQADDTYTYGVEKLLPIPTLDKYTFVGWSDKDGKMWKTIPAGTTGDMVLYANWSSDRAKAEAVKNLGEPIVCEDSENGLILFGYEIGTIKNIPLYTTLQLQCANGLISTVSMTNQNTISVTDAKTVANKISNATTNSSTWTLSKDWQKTTEVSQSYLDQTGESREEAEQSATSSTGTYNVAQSNSGKKSTTDTSGGTYNLSINNGHSNTQTVEKGSSYELGVNTKISSEISAEYAGIEAKIGAEIGTSENYSESSKRTSSGTNSWGINFDKTNTKSHASVDESSWNTSSGYSESNTVSKNNTVSKAVSKMISQQYGYGSSYAEGGSNSESNALTSTDTSSNEFSSSLTYSNSQIETKTTSFSSTGNTHGNYRMVMSGTAHVFAVVCYDVAKKEYFVYTYSVLGDGSNGDDAPKEYLDYSWDGTFDDYETSVIPFEIPYYVNQYVNGRIIKTDGLTIDLDTGIVEGYTPNQNNPDNMVVIPSYVRVDNNDGTFSSVKIKGISPRLFKDNTDIVGVSLSSFIDEIPESAFEGCTSLKEVICPNVTKIADNAFSGCTSLSDFTLSESIKEIGTDAFKNVPNIKAVASSVQMAQSVASCGAERISLDISAIPESESANMLFDIGEITSFELQGKDKEYKGLGIKSDANTTIINGVTFTENTQIPMELSSENVTLDRVTVDCNGYALVLKAADTNLVLNRTINLISDSENTVLCKNISLSNLNSSVVGKLNVNGNLLVNGSISGENYITVSDGEIIYISDEDFENYLSMHSVYFDANGGTVGTEYITIPYNSTFGELPRPSRDYYTFDGWYTEADGGEKITEDSIMTALTDITLYAHWNHNSVSAWVSASSLPEGAEVVDRKWGYTQTYYTTSSSPTIEGWNQYNSTWAWSNYGGVSDWGTWNPGASDSRYVETRTTYRYHRYTCSDCGDHHPISGECHAGDFNVGNYSHGHTCGGNGWVTVPNSSYEEIWIVEYLWTDGYFNRSNPYSNNYRCVLINGYGSDANADYTKVWWWDGNQIASRTEYRYCDRSKIYTYYFNRSEYKESASYPSGDNISNIQEWVQYRTK